MTYGRFVTALVLIVAMVTPAAGQSPRAPISLDGVADRVVQRNLAVEAARHRLDAARAEQIAARLRPNPSLTVGADNLKMSGPTSSGELYEVSTTYSHPIELGGKRERRLEVADLTVAVAEAQVADVVHQRLVEAKRAFYEGLLARDAVERARTIHMGYEELVALTQARFEEGDVAEGEVIKARLERARAATAVAQAQLALRQAIIRLLDLLGETAFDSERPLVGDLVVPQAPPLLAELRETASRERPSLVALERTADLAARRVALERARATPDVSPYLGYRRVGENNTALFGITIRCRSRTATRAASRGPSPRKRPRAPKRRFIATVSWLKSSWRGRPGRRHGPACRSWRAPSSARPRSRAISPRTPTGRARSAFWNSWRRSGR